MTFTVTVVCSGNICRSPLAEVLLREALEEAGLAQSVQVNSAGTGSWHLGDDMDRRARAALEEAGYSPPVHSARAFDDAEFHSADLILAADSSHFRDLTTWAPDSATAAKVRLLRSFDSGAKDIELADPYYGDARDFVQTYEQVAAAVPGIVAHVRAAMGR